MSGIGMYFNSCGFKVTISSFSSAWVGTDLRDGQELIVTAQKRSENVQHVPISVAAFSGQTLIKSNVTDISQLGKLASNYQATKSVQSSFMRVNIRGIGAITICRNMMGATNPRKAAAGTVRGDLVRILDEIGVARIHLQGISYGGFVALEFARIRATDELRQRIELAQERNDDVIHPLHDRAVRDGQLQGRAVGAVPVAAHALLAVAGPLVRVEVEVEQRVHARLQRDAMGDNAGLAEPTDDAMRHVAGALRGAAGQNDHVALRKRPPHGFTRGTHDLEPPPNQRTDLLADHHALHPLGRGPGLECAADLLDVLLNPKYALGLLLERPRTRRS